MTIIIYLTLLEYIQNSQVVIKCAAPKSQDEKRCENKGGSKEMAVMAKILTRAIQVNLVLSPRETWRRTHKLT